MCNQRLRAWRLHGRGQDSDAVGAEDRIEGVGELRIPVADEKLDLSDAVFQLHEQVAGLLGHPRPGRAGRHAQDVDTAGSKLDHEQHIQALQQDGVDWKKSQARIPVACADRNCRQVSPARQVPGRCRPA